MPLSQAELMVETIRRNGGYIEYVTFEGEGHGWRKGNTIRIVLEKELAFYQRFLAREDNGHCM